MNLGSFFSLHLLNLPIFELLGMNAIFQVLRIPSNIWRNDNVLLPFPSHNHLILCFPVLATIHICSHQHTCASHHTVSNLSWSRVWWLCLDIDQATKWLGILNLRLKWSPKRPEAANAMASHKFHPVKSTSSNPFSLRLFPFPLFPCQTKLILSSISGLNTTYVDSEHLSTQASKFAALIHYLVLHI